MTNNFYLLQPENLLASYNLSECVKDLGNFLNMLSQPSISNSQIKEATDFFWASLETEEFLPNEELDCQIYDEYFHVRRIQCQNVPNYLVLTASVLTARKIFEELSDPNYCSTSAYGLKAMEYWTKFHWVFFL